MHRSAKLARLPLSAALAALAQLTFAGTSRAAEPLHVEGGAIANTAPDAQGIRAFKGIPYAAPPAGGRRWKPPQAVPAWSGVRSTTEWGARRMQSNRLGDIDPLNTRMDEDCLYLNVWPPTSATEKLAVMVWIHGGSNLNGAGSQLEYDGARLAGKRVVVVTIDYRLDIFGFLATPKAAIIAACFANENCFDRSLHVVVDAAPTNPAIEPKRLIVRVEHQLLGLAKIDAHKRHAAVRHSCAPP